MKLKSQIITAVSLSLFVSANLCAQPGPAERRPSLDEVKPVLQQSAEKAVQTVLGSTRSEVTLAKVEILEMTSPGWRYSSTSTNGVLYWPVRIKCSCTVKDEDGKSTDQRLGITYRLSRDEEGRWKAKFLDMFDPGTLEERADKLKKSRDAVRRATEEARRNACISNLRQLDGAKMQWALEMRKSDSDTPTVAELKEYLSRKQMVICPEGGAYTIGPMSTAPTCSIKGHNL